MARLKPVTPGELLLEEFLVPMGISKYRLANPVVDAVSWLMLPVRDVMNCPGWVTS